MTDERLSTIGVNFLVLKVTCLTIYMYILLTLFTNLELQNAESICKTLAAMKYV